MVGLRVNSKHVASVVINKTVLLADCFFLLDFNLKCVASITITPGPVRSCSINLPGLEDRLVGLRHAVTSFNLVSRIKHVCYWVFFFN